MRVHTALGQFFGLDLGIGTVAEALHAVLELAAPKLTNTSWRPFANSGLFFVSSTVMVPPLKIPREEKTSGCATVMDFVCMPPIDRPAMAR